MDLQHLNEYELIKEQNISDLKSVGYIFKHKKSGARIAILSNDDENKVFYIGFRTPPKDSTGLPHILEHSVLCGSKNFPSKDPFVELVKGSLNTFLNAMTYPDKTVYPVASCNDKDFQNLIHVYMDAVFYTNIYEKEEIFRQEGWHYELEDEEAPITLNGVVYNEMKGAFSSPEGLLDREILNSLFPDNEYSNESGGNPEYIPDLKYSEFLNFHSRYYQPSNSYIYLYGDMDIEEKLKWLDQEYLSKYDAITVDSEIKYQKAFDTPIEVRKQYSISSSESLEDNTYLSYNKVIADSLNKELCVAFQILEYALLSAPGAPLKKALLDAKIGKDIMGSYDCGVYQPIFSIIAKNSNLDKKEEFLSIIQSTLQNIIEQKIDQKALKAGINYYEFKYREADFGNYPKGLMYGLEMLDSWLYDENQPFMHIEALETFAFLKNKIGTGYYESLIEQYLLNNHHASIVIVEPERGLTASMEQKLKEKLSKYKESLSKDEIAKLIEETKQLKQYQEEPSTKEEIEKIPLLQREDLKKEVSTLSNKEYDYDGLKMLHHDYFTNEIAYINLLFEVSHIPEELVPYLGILKSVLGYVDTEHYAYGDLFNEININTGGIASLITVYPNVKSPDAFSANFIVKGKALYEKVGYMLGMMKEIMLGSKLEDEKRLYEIIAQLKSRMQMTMNTSGHSIAVMRSSSYFSPVAYYNDLVSGVTFYRVVEKIENNFETEKVGLIEKLQHLIQTIFTSKSLLIDLTSDETGLHLLQKELKNWADDFFANLNEGSSQPIIMEQKNEGFMTSSKVQYVARSGNFVKKGYDYTGALKILKVILSYDYLWNNVRVKGGAYGCMSGFTMSGDSYFASYRDPNLEKTNEIFENTVHYVENFDVDERDMTKYIIGTISDMDTPLNPAAKGARSLAAYFNQVSLEDLQKERNQVLTATPADIRHLSGIIAAILEENYLCVLGNEDKIKEQKQLFNTIENLFN